MGMPVCVRVEIEGHLGFYLSDLSVFLCSALYEFEFVEMCLFLSLETDSEGVCKNLFVFSTAKNDSMVSLACVA